VKLGILLINLGTPDSYSVVDVRRFLREFLMDPLVINLPFLRRWMLVNGIIAPFRGPKAAKEYQRLWTPQGSPLKVHSEKLLNKLTKKFDEKHQLALAMRYQNPSVASALKLLREGGCGKLLVVPLFPQYAEATTLSTIKKVTDELVAMNWQVPCDHIDSFATDENFINGLVSRTQDVDILKVDYTVFSYHGLPEQQLKNVSDNCLTENCCSEITDENKNCYKAQCFATSRAIAEKLNLSDQQYRVCFQSRQGKMPWIRPYTDDVIKELAKKGYQNLRVFSPAFVADCLETTIEIGETYRDLFKEFGGNELHLVPGLNSSDVWVDALESIICNHMERS